MAALSGGNQQKVLFARMLMCGPRVLIADEPTRGVDVGAKRAIYDLLVGLAADGMGVLLISSEVEEILGLAHRVLVMSRGRIVTELRGEEMTESAILSAAFSEKAARAERGMTTGTGTTPTSTDDPTTPSRLGGARILGRPGSDAGTGTVASRRHRLPVPDPVHRPDRSRALRSRPRPTCSTSSTSSRRR